MLDLSIIIVNWNTSQMLADCLRSVQTTTRQVQYEVIVVDNASTDGSQEMVAQQFPQVKLIANTENVGFARANNQAMAVAQGRYWLLLNSDAFVKANTIDRTVAFMDAHPEAGMCGCKLLYADGRLQPSCFSFPTLTTELYITLGLSKLFPRSREFGKYAMTYWDYNDTRPVDVIMGAYMLVRAEAGQQVGLMDESFFMYSEEVDWCYRFKQAGWPVYYVHDVETVHLWGGSSSQIRVESLIRMYRSRVQFFRKHYGAASAWGYKLLLRLNCLLRIGAGAALQRPHLQQKSRDFQQLLAALPGF